MEELTFYDRLVKISEGDESMLKRLRHYDEHDIIENVRFNRKNPSQSVVTLQFDSEQYYDLFYDSEDSDFVNRLFDYYNDYDLVGYDTFENEWNEGYLVNMLNPDIIRRIVKNTNPTYKLDLNTWGGFEESSEIASMLIDKYYREVTRIISEYESVVNQKLKEDYKKNINQDLDNKLTYLNLFEISEGSKYATNIKSLI